MAHIFNGRYTAVAADPFVVFLIGMRINRLAAVRQWLPVLRAMPAMIETLYKYPEKGFLGGHFFIAWRMPLLVSYWRSFADLEAFARHPGDPHLPAWKRFNQAVGDDGSVGIWHETYVVEPGSYECVYGNMPRFGLGAVMQHVPAVGHYQTAHKRLQAQKASE
jgi:hypothetical protein